jgi:hypothetical protein
MRIHNIGKRTGGSETSQYPQEEKSIEIPPVAASERGRAQTRSSNRPGVVGLLQGVARRVIKSAHRRRLLERTTIEGDSPVTEMSLISLEAVPEYRGTRVIPWESGRTIFQG